MAQILACERDGNFFIERAPGSIAIQSAVVYDENGKPQPFSGDLCPNCGNDIRNNRRTLLQLSPARDYHDKEGPEDA